MMSDPGRVRERITVQRFASKMVFGPTSVVAGSEPFTVAHPDHSLDHSARSASTKRVNAFVG